MSNQEFDKTLRIPVVTNLVIAGDPVLKRRAKDKNRIQKRQRAFELRLREKIKELESVTGQDEIKNIARAHAIRSEHDRTDEMNKRIDRAIDIHINKKHLALIKELNTLDNSSEKS